MSKLIRTTLRPQDQIVVSDDEYLELLTYGLVYGVAAPAPPDPDDVEVAGFLDNVTSQTYARLLAQLAANVAGGTGVLPDALRAALVPKWKASTAYASGEFVLNPSGQIVSANTAFTSGTTYSAGNWTIVGTASLPTQTGNGGKFLTTDGTAASWGTPAGGGTVSDATASAKGIVQLAGDLGGTAAAPTVAKIGGVTPAAVATSGAYTDLTGKPTLGGAAALSVGTAPGTVAAGDDSRFGTGVAQSLYGVKTQPWKPSPALGPELWALANFTSGSGQNNTTLTPSLTAAGSLVTLDTRVLLGNLVHHDTAFRVSLNVSGTPTTGWWKVSVLISDVSGNALTGTTEQSLAGDGEGNGLTGVRMFEFLPNASGVTSAATYLTVRLQVWNNVTSGQIVSINSVSVREIAHVSRPIRYGAITSYAGQAVMVPLYDSVVGKWRYAIHNFQPDSALSISFNGADGTTTDQPFNNVLFDPAFVTTMGDRGANPPLMDSTKTRSLRINNNDQILVVRKSDGTTFEFRGNTHGGEVNSPAATWQVNLEDGNGWQAWDGTGTRLRPAVRLQCHFPTTISRSAPDSDVFATVDHLLTYFPDGVIRMDRTTTFTQTTVVNQVIDWMSSHNLNVPKVGRIGRGLIVIDEVDIFPKLSAPALSTITTATTGGTLAAATYTYAVTAMTEGGETTAATGTIATTGTTSTTTIPWTTVTGATGYRVYGRTSGRLALLATLGPAATTWTDDGSAAALPIQPPIVNTARQLGATTFVQDAATSSNGYWGVWYDPVLDMCYANIYDRDAVLTRTGITAAKTRLEAGSGIVKSYLNMYWGAGTLSIASGTAWSATHWAYAYIPQDKKNYHLEAALLASDLAALKTNYPAA